MKQIIASVFSDTQLQYCNIFCNIFILCVRVSRVTYPLTKIKVVVGVIRMVFKTSIHL